MRHTFLIFLFLLISSWGYATEPLVFRPFTDGFRDEIILQFLKESYPDEKLIFHTSRTDLNGDGINEYIAAPAATQKNTIKPFRILSIKRRKVMDFGEINARKLEISDKKSNGFREILVYNDEGNDFHYVRWRWDGTVFSPAPSDNP